MAPARSDEEQFQVDFGNYLLMSNLLAEDFVYIRVHNKAPSSTERQAWGRTLIRAIWALSEGYAETVRLAFEKVHNQYANELSSKDREFLEGSRNLDAIERIKRSVSVLNVACGLGLKFDFISQPWQRVCRCNARRDAVTHPKTVEDLYISSSDIDDAMATLTWLISTHARIRTAISNNLH